MKKIYLFLLLIVGCTTNPVVINYSPSTLVERRGEIKVEKFNYKMKDDGKVLENEIQKTTVGDLIIDKKISELIENALRLEFKFSGLLVNANSNNVLTGTVEKLFFDDLGMNLDTELTIKYILSKNGKECFANTITSKKKSPKFSNPTGQISETIKENIETLLRDDKFISCVR